MPKNLAGELYPPEVVLSFPTGFEFIWKRDSLIKSLEGNTVSRISAAQAGYFLYVTNMDILWIDFVTERATQRPFLYWAVTD